MFTSKASNGVEFLFKKRLLNTIQIESSKSFLQYTDLHIEINATKQSFKKLNFFRCMFTRQAFEKITFSDCYFIECSFVACEFSNVEFHNSHFKNCLFEKPNFSQTYLDPKFLRFNFGQWKKDAANINTRVFQKLEANLRDIYQEDFAERAHIEFRRYRRWQDIYRLKKDIGLFKKIGLIYNFWVDISYEVALLYGYGLYRALAATVLALYVGTEFLDYFWCDLNLVSNSAALKLDKSSALQKLYFLVVTASTLGYGDVTVANENGMKFVIGILAFSVIWTATLTALIVKRLVK